jgi:hypothetical protein
MKWENVYFWFFATLFLLCNSTCARNCNKTIPKDSIQPVSVSVYPLNPIIETDKHKQYLNFDIVLKNNTLHTLQLVMMQISVIDDKGELVARKYLNQNGRLPSIAQIGNTILSPGESIDIFNPFYDFDREINVSNIKYEFYFDSTDSELSRDRNSARLPMDYDLAELMKIKTRVYIPKTQLYLPVKGRTIIWDGHDFYSHHRRFPIGLSKNSGKKILANSNRYAYDFVTINNKGEMFKNNPFEKENWFVFGKVVYAPGSGIVIETQNDVPDNSFENKSIKYPDIPTEMDSLGMGNHVIINHGNGEYSVILHMEKGSLQVKTGDRVVAGQKIGRVGFSGDAIFPHVHYTVMNGPNEQLYEGVPSNFRNYKLFTGNYFILVKKGRIDTGFIVESY